MGFCHAGCHDEYMADQEHAAVGNCCPHCGAESCDGICQDEVEELHALDVPGIDEIEESEAREYAADKYASENPDLFGYGDR